MSPELEEVTWGDMGGRGKREAGRKRQEENQGQIKKVGNFLPT